MIPSDSRSNLNAEGFVIRFQFRVNASFLSYLTHPITIPKTQVDYEVLRAQLGGMRDAEIRCPEGQVLDAVIYSGTAGYGLYYQIRCSGHPGDSMNSIQVETLLNVELRSSARGTSVRLTLA
jgi:hypothetical protein